MTPAPILATVPGAAQWLFLTLGSAFSAWTLEKIDFPAALFIGPMIAGVIISVHGGTIRLPRAPYVASQAFMGCLIAAAITPQIASSVIHDWRLLLGTVLAVLGASSLLGWVMAYFRVLPGTTGIWGTWPGAAPAMVVLAEAYGADARLVAFMQYLRVMCVALAASLVTRIWIGTTDAAPHETIWFPSVHWQGLGETLALAGTGAVIGHYIRLPSGPLVVPLAVGSILNATGYLHVELPPWLLVGIYALLGWGFGLVFTRAILGHARRAFPKILASILLLIAFCGVLAYVLMQALGIAPLTAYLATSPGSMDSIAIIASAANADLSFVMALQTVRFFIVVFAGPPLARLLARSLS
jgi:membrane AbrB-like protein